LRRAVPLHIKAKGPNWRSLPDKLLFSNSNFFQSANLPLFATEKTTGSLMPKEDWLEKEIRKLAQVLAKLLRFKLAGKDTELLNEAGEALKNLPAWSDDEPDAETASIRLIEAVANAEQAKNLSDIFKEKALAHERLNQPEAAKRAFIIALRLAEWADENEGVFSFENHQNLQFLKNKS
jgi:hypothetical protein